MIMDWRSVPLLPAPGTRSHAGGTSDVGSTGHARPWLPSAGPSKGTGATTLTDRKARHEWLVVG